MATIKEIAKLSGVSRGTVDRVLNNRGKVNPEKEALVRKVAEELNYRPNKAAQGLAASKAGYRLSVILTSIGNPFFDEVIRGVRAAARELEDYRATVNLVEIKGYKPEDQIAAIKQEATEANVILLNPINHPDVAKALKEVNEQGVAVLHLNTELPDSERLCYVGSSYYNSGRTAAALMGLIVCRPANILMVTGSQSILGHNQRMAGFRDVLKESYPDVSIGEVINCEDDDDIAYTNTLEALRKQTFNGIYVVAAGTAGVCRAVKELNLSDEVSFVCSDTTDINIRYMKEGMIDAAIAQEPYLQGYQSVKLAFEYLAYNTELKPAYIMKDEIKLVENLNTPEMPYEEFRK